MFLRNAALQLAINYTPHYVVDYTPMTDAFKAGTLVMKKSLCDAVRTEYYFIDALIIVFAYGDNTCCGNSDGDCIVFIVDLSRNTILLLFFQ